MFSVALREKIRTRIPPNKSMAAPIYARGMFCGTEMMVAAKPPLTPPPKKP